MIIIGGDDLKISINAVQNLFSTYNNNIQKILFDDDTWRLPQIWGFLSDRELYANVMSTFISVIKSEEKTD